MPDAWRYLPGHIDPIAFSAGPVTVRWYGVAYVSGMAVIFLFLLFRSSRKGSPLAMVDVWDMALFTATGAIFGAHAGYALLYAPGVFLAHPTRFFWPFDPVTGAWTGIAGMSFHGGLIGAALGLLIFAVLRHRPFWPLADELALAVPLGLFFGRIGNFLNSELVGRVASGGLGMYFPSEGSSVVLRYPSQLFEAFGEGVFLFLVLFWYGRCHPRPGEVSLLFVVAYGCVRSVAEFWREPDPQIGLLFGGYLTIGQVLSLFLAFCGLVGWRILRRRDILGVQGT